MNRENPTENTEKTAGGRGWSDSTKIRKIPEKLKILPTDSEKVKKQKQRKIKAIKRHNRHANLTKERIEKQSSWQCNFF